MRKINWKKIIGILAATMGVMFVITSVVAKKKKGSSQYENESDQKNPLEGKKVIFVENDEEIENADGVRGHLEAIGNSDYKPGFYEKYIKRGFDVVLSFGGLVVLSPVLGAIALAIKIDDPGSVLFTQKRMGQNKKYFKLHKFRSMKMRTPHDVPTHQLENPEQYITRVGKFLRSHSLDELPQIWDIFIGNMSVIGPRPGLWNQDILTAERDKYNANDVKPGLTGWAQINGRDELEIPVKAKLDGEYVKHMGLLMDVKCFLGSLGVFAGDESVVEGGTGEMKKTGRSYTDGKSVEELIGNIGFGEAVQVDTTTKRKVLITGAGSYIGESFKAYAAEKYGNNFDIEEVDMLDGTWRDIDFSKYDIVYHVAGIAHADVGNVDDATKEKYYAVNTDLTVEVCRKAKTEGVKEFIFMSSMIVYGDSVSVIKAMKRSVVDSDVDVVHINSSCSYLGIYRDYLCARIAKKRNIPIVFHCHCNIKDQILNKPGAKVLKKICNIVAMVLVLNTESQKYISYLTNTKTIIVPNFIEKELIADSHRINEKIKKIVFVGHVQRTKGAFEILDVARKLSEIEFVLVGPVSDEIKQENIPPNYVLEGAKLQSDIPRYLQEADVFLFPSYTEGFSISLTEAMA